MDRQGDGSEKGSRNRDSRKFHQEISCSAPPTSPQPPVRQNPSSTTTTTTASTIATPNTTRAPQPRQPHQHPIPPPIHPPFHPYTPQLNPPVSTPESLPTRRNFPTLAPLPIADLYRPGGTSYIPQQGVFDGASLGAGTGASHAIPVGGSGDMQASGASSGAGLPNPKGRYNLKKRESNPNRPATAPRPYVVRPKSKSGGKSSRVSRSKKSAKSSGTATSATADFEACIDTAMETLTGVMDSMNSIAGVIHNLEIQEQQRMQARAAAAAAAAGRRDLVYEEEEDEDECEEDEEDEEEN